MVPVNTDIYKYYKEVYWFISFQKLKIKINTVHVIHRCNSTHIRLRYCRINENGGLAGIHKNAFLFIEFYSFPDT